MKIGFCPGIEHKAVFKAKTTKRTEMRKTFLRGQLDHHDTNRDGIA